MGSPKAYSIELLRTSVTLILVISLSLAFFPCNSVALKDQRKQKKMVMGSKPPSCFNKCFTCKPCKAALVIIYPHRRNDVHSNKDSGGQGGDEGYYLLSWKCKCGNKFFQP
ncbi:EPIDERMAL PATTERNING FACTOR-like protein 8 [Prosopis cineraria]|uniref:EPIDERMAL PATTERNING FACTOR-like protein 8 n=1 Tax=Prosopis cineraria TaxID=364024 RepID=UPI00240FDE8F|nr:EPIDERMAL PATTERNING FACTOR-like protein 8 [Prosopis cineraria]